MKLKIKETITGLILLFTLFAPPLRAASNDFVIKKIDVQGLQRISEGTVYSYLPVKVDDAYTVKSSQEIIQALYDTGFFSDISLARQSDTLIVQVVERPVIGKVTLSGNKDIPTDKLMPALKDSGLSEGLVYDNSLLDKIEKSLQSQYYSRGKYNARIEVKVNPQERNRVDISINISEGRVAVIKKINIVGYQAFSEAELMKNITLTPSSWRAYFSHSDQYSKQALDASLENLRSYYMDRGYIKFRVDSTQVAITPDRKEVYITINVTEGPQYTVKGFDLAGDLILPEDKLKPLVTLSPNNIFSRKAVLKTNEALRDALGDVGYYFAEIEAKPEIDDAAKTVYVSFVVQPGRLVYVRQIHFYGNDRTNDYVLRRAMRQMEGGLLTTDALEKSKWRMQQLDYIKDIKKSVERVPNTDNQVDVNYQVRETPSASINASIGFSQLEGVILSAGVNQGNFLGTGNALGLGFSRSKGYQNYSLNYFNPYYTQNGVSRRISLYLRDTDPGEVNISGSYTLSQYGTDFTYGFPINETVGSVSNVSMGYGLSKTTVKTSNDPSTQVSDFVRDFGTGFRNIRFNLGWSYNGLDRALFPTKGFRQSIGSNIYAPLDRDSIGYYKLNYSNAFYQPITARNIFRTKAEIGFGDAFTHGATLPFYSNYYAGGNGSVRGYEGNTLGPRDSKGDPMGGNLTMSASVGWIFPSPLSPDSVRTVAFVDAGNVFRTYSNPGDGGVDLGDIRYSTGIEIDWRSPMGTINFSFSKALNPSSVDETRFFDFSVGTSF